MISGGQRKNPFDRWTNGIEKAVSNRKWDVYDCEIRMIAGEYNVHLQTTPGYKPLDWRLVKAMIWTETGAGSPEWKTKPMQIGVAGRCSPDLATVHERTDDSGYYQKHSRTQYSCRSRLSLDEAGLL
jgi:hypothetical protein